MIGLDWMRDVLLFVPAAVTAWRLSLARSYQIRASRVFRTLPETEKTRLNTVADTAGDWSELSQDARKVRDFRNTATTLTTFSGLLPTWCLVSLGTGLLLQAWLVFGPVLTGDAAPPAPR